MSSYDISYTGVRSGEYIIGRKKSKQCEGCILQVRLVDDDDNNTKHKTKHVTTHKVECEVAYPVSQVSLNDIDPLFVRDAMNCYEFFAPLDYEKRMQHLKDISIAKDNLYLNEIANLEVKVIELRGDFIVNNLSETQLQQLIAGNPDDPDGYWPLSYIYNLFPRKPNSKARFHTLIFRPSNWCLHQMSIPITNYQGQYIDLYTGVVDYQCCTNSNIQVLDFTGYQMATTVAKGSKENVMPLINLRISAHLEWCSIHHPSVFKSLLQKIIRFAPTTIVFPHIDGINTIIDDNNNTDKNNNNGDEMFTAEDVLITTFLMLMVHSGSFNPDLQKWTSGLESSLKRLAVTIAEDSYLEDTGQLTSLLAGALLSNRCKEWFPPLDLVEYWCDIAIMALHDNRMFKYSLTDIKRSNDLNSLLLTELGSFESDIVMFHSIANNDYCSRDIINDNNNNEFMYVEHCLDHHCLTELAHMLPYDDVKHCGNYSQLFSDIWTHNSSSNLRRGRQLDPTNPFVANVQKAQLLLWISKAVSTVRTKASKHTTGKEQVNNVVNKQEHKDKEEGREGREGEKMVFDNELDDCWLASIIGTQEYKFIYITYYVMLGVNNIRDIVVLRKPSRDSSSKEAKDGSLDPEVEDALIQRFIKSLAYPSYIKVKHIPAYIGMSITGVTVHEDEYYLLDAQGVIGSWNDVKKQHCEVGTFTTHYHTDDHWFKMNINNHINNQNSQNGSDNNNGVANNCIELLQLELDRVDLNRLLYYISGVKSVIQMDNIGRDGTGSNYTVQPEDNLVFEFLCALTLLFPVCITRDDNKFTICNFTIWCCIRDIIKGRVNAKQSTIGNNIVVGNTNSNNVSGIQTRWQYVDGQQAVEGRKLWLHQVHSLDRLKATQQQHSLIWIPAGLGKTAIITNYIVSCIDNGTMPKYCVYTLPPSALASVTNEFTLLSIPWQTLDMTAKGKVKQLKPYCVNFVLHDHLRLLFNNQHTNNQQLGSQQLGSNGDCMSDTLFIIDEFHKTLNRTQRTSTALNMAARSWRFIAMTGTLIKDTHVEYIIEWLRLVNNFEVTKDNFWLALTCLICHKVQIPVTVNRETVSYDMSDNLLQQYKNAVPVTLGGNLPGNIKWKLAVDISYQATTEALFDYCCQYLGDILPDGTLSGRRCFVVTRNVQHQTDLNDMIVGQGYSCLCIGSGNSVSLTPDMPEHELPDVVITTVHHCEGYNLTAYSVMLTGVYFSNAATREQLEKRIVRIGQLQTEVNIVVIHTGILSYVHSRYEKVRSLASALKSLATETNLSTDGIDV